MIAEPQPIVAGRTSGWAPMLLAFDQNVTRIERLLVGLAAVSIFATMWIMVADVLGRYLFHRPLSWAYDVISIYLLPAIIFLALSDAFRKNHHLAVDILYNVSSPVMQKLSRFLTSLVIAGVTLPIAWLAVLQAYDRYTHDTVIAGAILWPTWIPSLIVGAGSGLLVLRTVLDGLALLAALLSGSADVPGESPSRQDGETDLEREAI